MMVKIIAAVLIFMDSLSPLSRLTKSSAGAA